MNFIQRFNQRLNHHRKWFYTFVIVVLAVGVFVGWQHQAMKKVITAFLGSSQKAVLKISPSGGQFEVGQEFNVDIILDTKNNNVVAAGVYIEYDPQEIEVVDIDTTGSDFLVGSECQYQGGPCQLINHDSAQGKLEIVVGRPTPGVNKRNALVATLVLKGLKESSPSNDNFRFQFAGSYQGKTRVILDDGQGTDILSGVENGRFSFYVPQPPFTPDVNNDNRVDYNDLVHFIILYRNGDQQADAEEDGDVDYNDLIKFVMLYRTAHVN